MWLRPYLSRLYFANFLSDLLGTCARARATRRQAPSAVIPHPLSSLTAEQVKQRAVEVLPEILSILGIEEGARNAAAAAL